MDAYLLPLINRSLASPRLDDLMLMLSAAALVVLPGLGLWLLLQRRHRRLALVLLGAVGTTLALALLLQHAVGRPRPEGVRLLIPTPALSGFPSGHASMVWCAVVLLGLACRRPGPWLGGVLAASVVCVSRVYLGHHFPTDVLGGALLGAGVGAAFFGVWIEAPRRGRPAGRLRWLLWPELAMMALITELAYLGLLPRGWTHGVPHVDKWLHFTFYGLLAFLLHLWLDGRCVTRLRIPLVPLIVIVAADRVPEAGQDERHKAGVIHAEVTEVAVVDLNRPDRGRRQRRRFRLEGPGGCSPTPAPPTAAQPTVASTGSCGEPAARSTPSHTHVTPMYSNGENVKRPRCGNLFADGWKHR